MFALASRLVNPVISIYKMVMDTVKLVQKLQTTSIWEIVLNTVHMVPIIEEFIVKSLKATIKHAQKIVELIK